MHMRKCSKTQGAGSTEGRWRGSNEPGGDVYLQPAGDLNCIEQGREGEKIPSDRRQTGSRLGGAA